MNVGIIGCGTISDAYFNGAARSELIRVKACADINEHAAQSKAAQHGVASVSVGQLLEDPEIEIVINLTVPQAHAPVSQDILRSGKHVYLEKPLATDLSAAKRLLADATALDLRVGCAPDTFLGASHQACRAVIDEGRIGKPVGGAAAMLSRGMEWWHPNPEFFFKRGGGPVHDMGGYYVTQLVNLLGPVARVTACASKGLQQRVITSEPLRGSLISVEVPTTVNGALQFVNGANVALSMSWDVGSHERAPIEIYGTEGSVIGANPNYFGGEPRISECGGEWQPIDIGTRPFGADNVTTRMGARAANYRAVGVVDMAAAIRQGRRHRASGALAFHVLEVLDALERSSFQGRHITIESVIARPDPVPLGIAEEALTL